MQDETGKRWRGTRCRNQPAASDECVVCTDSQTSSQPASQTDRQTERQCSSGKTGHKQRQSDRPSAPRSDRHRRWETVKAPSAPPATGDARLCSAAQSASTSHCRSYQACVSKSMKAYSLPFVLLIWTLRPVRRVSLQLFAHPNNSATKQPSFPRLSTTKRRRSCHQPRQYPSVSPPVSAGYPPWQGVSA